jgi:hypothetical protein
MTYRRSKIIKLCWLHYAEPAQSKCADRSGARLTKATQQDTTGILGSKVHDPLGPTAVKNAKRSAKTAVPSAVRTLSP